MPRQIAWALAALFLVPAAGRASERCEREQTPQRASQAAPAQPGAEKPGDHKGLVKWWIDAQARTELGITDAQSAEIDEVWQKDLPKLRDGRILLEKQEDLLSQMIRSDAAETSVIAQIDKVEAMRAELSKARAVMLYRMNRVLKPEQRDKVKARMERRDRDGGRRGPSVP